MWAGLLGVGLLGGAFGGAVGGARGAVGEALRVGGGPGEGGGDGALEGAAGLEGAEVDAELDEVALVPVADPSGELPADADDQDCAHWSPPMETVVVEGKARKALRPRRA